MELSKTTVGVLAVLCVAGGAGGAYLATHRGEPTSAPMGATAPPAADPAPPVPDVTRSVSGVSSDSPRSVRPTPASSTDRRAGAPQPAVPEVPESPVARRDPEWAPEPDSLPLPAPSVETRHVPPPAFEPEASPEPEAVRSAEPVLPEFEDLIIPADSVVGLRMETLVTSENARIEDEVVARVTRDVRVGDRVAIPAGATAHGEVTLVERGGRLRDRARLGIRFLSVVLADGTRIPIETDMVYREGDASGRESAAKIGGGAIGGAIIGGLFGGKKGAVIGATTGAGTGTAAVIVGGRNPATLPAGTPVTVRVITPATVTVER